MGRLAGCPDSGVTDVHWGCWVLFKELLCLMVMGDLGQSLGPGTQSKPGQLSGLGWGRWVSGSTAPGI